jgi:hypothetical protein
LCGKLIEKGEFWATEVLVIAWGALGISSVLFCAGVGGAEFCIGSVLFGVEVGGAELEDVACKLFCIGSVLFCVGVEGAETGGDFF